MSDRPLIFITNDDGINAEGIHQLIDMAAPLGDIIAVVPDSPRSGGSTAITCGAILRPKAYTSRDGVQIWTLNGTPADCVKLGLSALSPRRPDLLLSGINHGSNTGNSIVYSGTMGATLEGCLQKIDSIGFSLTSHRPAASDFQACRHVVETIVGMVLRDGLPENVCLNVNIPAGGVVKGMRRARACKGRWTKEYAAYVDPSGEKFYMLTGKYVNDEPEATDTDLYWLARGYAAVVPSTPDRDYLEDLNTDFNL